MQGPDGEMGSEGETHLPFLCRVCGHADTHTRFECCPLLLGVLASLMRCERGTEMEQVEEQKEVDQRNGARVRKIKFQWAICDKGRVGVEFRKKEAKLGKKVGKRES